MSYTTSLGFSLFHIHLVIGIAVDVLPQPKQILHPSRGLIGLGLHCVSRASSRTPRKFHIKYIGCAHSQWIATPMHIWTALTNLGVFLLKFFREFYMWVLCYIISVSPLSPPIPHPYPTPTFSQIHNLFFFNYHLDKRAKRSLMFKK